MAGTLVIDKRRGLRTWFAYLAGACGVLVVPLVAFGTVWNATRPSKPPVFNNITNITIFNNNGTSLVLF